MDDSFRTIRSLQTDFVVVRRTDMEIVLAVDTAEFAGIVGPAKLRFSRPRGARASRWNPDRCEWVDARELCMPASGSILEAHVKPVPGGISLSFSDKKLPLVRWGFTADAVAVEPDLRQPQLGAGQSD